jgi:hypothetical protein
MNRTKIIALTVVLLLVLVSTAGAGSSAQYTIDWDVSSAGGASMQSSSYGLAGTIAQPVSGVSSSPSYVLCAGYWCGMAIDYPIYLPLIVRDG